MSFSPKKQDKSIVEQAVEQVEKYQKANKILSDAGSSGQVSVSGKGDISIKSPSGAVKDVEGTAKAIVKGIKEGNLPPTLTGMSRTAGLTAAIEKEAVDQGFNLKQAQLDYAGALQLTKTMNQNQIVQLKTAINSTRLDIEPMRQLNKEFERVDFTPFNKVTVSARMHGIDLGDGKTIQVPDYQIDPGAFKNMTDSQVSVATKFITQLNLMKDNMAVAFVRGGVPTDQAFQLANQILNPIYGQKQLDSALDQVEYNLKLRERAWSEIPPYSVGGKNQGTSSMLQQTGLTSGQPPMSMKDGTLEQSSKDFQFYLKAIGK